MSSAAAVDSAPGQSSSQQEPICYNCGTRGHWVVACPEPTRDVPAPSSGLQRWQSQHQEGHSSDRNAASHDKKGPVVTRYPLPPSQGPTITRYGPPQPPAYPPGAPPPPSIQAYPPASFPPPPPPPPLPTYSGSYHPPPPAVYGQFPPAVPPPPSQYAPQPPYGQPQYPPPYPPSNYYPNGVPPPPPGAYPPQPYSQPGPPLPVPPPPVPPPYPSSYSGPPQPEYHYSPGQNPTYPPPTGWVPPPFAPPHLPPPPPSNSGANKHRGKRQNQGPKHSNAQRDRHDRHNRDEGNDRVDRFDRHDRYDRSDRFDKRDRDDGFERGERLDRIDRFERNDRNQRPERHDRPARFERAERNDRNDRRRNVNDSEDRAGPGRQERRKEPRTVQPERTSKPTNSKTAVPEPKEDVGNGEWDPASEKDMQRIFPELDVKPADPVGIPLPATYTDDPTIPPAYNAKCVKSLYFNDQNEKEFAFSVRETSFWSVLKLDPVFKFYPGMIRKRIGEHEYTTHIISAPPHPEAKLKLPPKFTISRNQPKETPEIDRYRPRPDQHRDFSPKRSAPRDQPPSGFDRAHRCYQQHPKRPLDDTFDGRDRDPRDAKRLRQSLDTPDRGHGRDANPPPPRRPSPNPRYNFSADPWSPQAGETKVPSIDHRYNRDTYYDNRSSSSRDDRDKERGRERPSQYADMRHDSGYHSSRSRSQERKPRRSFYRDDYRDRDRDRDNRPLSGPYQQRKRTRSRSRSRSPASSYLSPARSIAKRSRSASRGRSLTRSRSRSRSRSERSESPLTALDKELLGLTDEPNEPVKSKVVPKKVAPRVKVAAAFGRRW
ncbi:hypothetical protein NEUTE1DRAFT_128427 [Neurospora tetrasperma FGSC 2508]|uniref:CCHC-type domain-containing protein n=1 Tax=Neurospora tetrasperma (strain FGSC 2508 / ATCC MYA-4615 / P0657) TaxID=510951 RepID=F8MI50_NEUT8|nr:uncharacterized protein NEUTE1DRAFT_128427 [Neurospora tetrasperma FGSC 2508]EGO58906.1 hypothetical protein NEUTE1DRAFT_128427 [Neurospora tetrasperma FGSC 2508]EGZ73007.1 hypothetical protein NEUTE2DRAFT_107061 [Neurospora tetrasperma FGSC 2509]